MNHDTTGRIPALEKRVAKLERVQDALVEFLLRASSADGRAFMSKAARAVIAEAAKEPAE